MSTDNMPMNLNDFQLVEVFRCDCCGIPEVETEYAYCDACVEEIVRWLEIDNALRNIKMKEEYLAEVARKYEGYTPLFA